jgi:hypothetical protein
MAMGRLDAVQDDLMATRAEMPPGHAFYDRLHPCGLWTVSLARERQAPRRSA